MWKIVPLYLLGCLWRETNAGSFEDHKKTSEELHVGSSICFGNNFAFFNNLAFLGSFICFSFGD